MSSTRITKRLRIFAGPNGSGKTTIIDAIKREEIDGFPIDFGIYVNADEIVKDLRNDNFSFSQYGVNNANQHDFVRVALKSGLIRKPFDEMAFLSSFSFNGKNHLTMKDQEYVEYLAQVLAEYLREMLLECEQKLSFETVLSHSSKIDFMRKAREKGYRIYLYFISTENPQINVSRVKDVRVGQGGHNVDEGTIEKRYFRTMNFMHEASQLCYQAYFFDNSTSTVGSEPFAHFRYEKSKKNWDKIDPSKTPYWFVEYYSKKVLIGKAAVF